MGDFNEIVTDDEKLGGYEQSRRLMEDFREAPDSYGLEDLGFLGPAYTWYNKQAKEGDCNTKASRQ